MAQGGQEKACEEAQEERLSLRFKRIVADAGYESEGKEAFIKPADYEQCGTKKRAAEIGHKDNMEYDVAEDCYICHNGKKIKKQYEKGRKTASGYIRMETHYHCNDCDGCPYKEKCMPGQNWKKPIEERYKSLIVSRKFEELRKKGYALIDSEEGKENVYAESILFAMAHNLGWLHSRIQNDKLEEHLYDLKATSEKAA